ncbi:hypothetical protein L3X38_044061 [Prunus dulcis]|uniref:Uncharacterized protein n=1 Tax=Prunus dulcis TaxID=3755 RepID=A0AAD4UXX1_PRUDU|nr:hypothetical protein L3X38_044061 [Prunus dulcis]
MKTPGIPWSKSNMLNDLHPPTSPCFRKHFFCSSFFIVVTSLLHHPSSTPFKLETGYVAVGNLDDIQLFYFFIESERSPKEDPLLLWLSGGPGCSSFTAMVYNSTDAWTKIANVIFLDQPVGTGYSYAKSWEEYRAGDTLSCTQTYEFLRKVKIWHSIDYHRNLTKKNLRALVYRYTD